MAKNSKIETEETEEKLKSDYYKPISINQKISIDQLKKHFPALYKEIAENHMSLKVKTESTDEDDAVKERSEDPFNNYMPNIIDFLRRAKSDKEGMEVIDFFEQQKQLSSEEAKEFREKLSNSGIRVFGSYKPPNYYFLKAEEINTKKAIKKRYSLYRETIDSER